MDQLLVRNQKPVPVILPKAPAKHDAFAGADGYRVG